jgi:hypothetical protein
LLRSFFSSVVEIAMPYAQLRQSGQDGKRLVEGGTSSCHQNAVTEH